MKKFLSIITAALILCLSLCPAVMSVSAAKYNNWVLGPDAEYITHDGLTYYPLYTDFSLYFDYSGANGDIYDNDYIEVELDFADKKTEEKYDGSFVYVATDVENECIEVYLYGDYYGDTTVYVEESKLQKYEDLANGICDNYEIDHLYEYERTYPISGEDYANWIEGEQRTMKARDMMYLDTYYIYAQDDLGLVSVECGMIIYDYDMDEYYLLRYSDYDRSYFYNDGVFATDSSDEVTVYRLEDDMLAQQITEFQNDIEDDLDWLVAEEVNATVAAVFCSVVFGFLPFALMVFSVVMLIKLKDKKYYRTYIIMLVGSALVLLACVGVFMILI